MAKVTFELVNNRTCDVVMGFTSLPSCIDYIRKFINEPRSYGVDELENGDMIDTCSAFYLIENYKDPKRYPNTLTEINDLLR